MKKNQIIKKILNRIKHSEMVYDQASRSVHSTAIKKELSTVRIKRKQYLKELMDAFYNHKNPGQLFTGLKDFTSKIWLKLNDLLIHRNVPNVLITCVEADQELLEYYGKTTEYDLNKKVSKLINQQKMEIQMQANDFQKMIKEYPWI